MKRALASRAAETVVMASREKLNAASAFCIGDMSLVNTLVVEGDTADSLLAPFENLGVTVVRA
ncbi:Transcriptional regulatory protein [Cronobacter universalis NCTC 9529]|nr:Transcriptional regulatory protein [Cronobacter universalis NCTC 9529]